MAVTTRPVPHRARAGDVVVAFSTSGRSANVLAAARSARLLEAVVWSFTGPAPNPLTASSSEAVAVTASSTPTVQEVHQIALHVLCEAFDRSLDQLHLTGGRHGS